MIISQKVIVLATEIFLPPPIYYLSGVPMNMAGNDLYYSYVTRVVFFHGNLFDR